MGVGMKKPAKTTKRQKYIKFIGDYGKLKKMGYQFSRMFASNYMCWCKHVDPEGYGDCIRVWKGGADVEFNDLFSSSYLVLEAIMRGEMAEVVYNFFGKSIHHHWMLNIAEGTIEPFDTTKHYDFQMAKAAGIEFDKNTLPIDDEKYREWYKVHCQTWRNFEVQPPFINLVRELIDNNMVEIAERDVEIA
jgi:hypothetical protein